jgi:RNA polymerase sigma-70 factor (ECF subfamily)
MTGKRHPQEGDLLSKSEEVTLIARAKQRDAAALRQLVDLHKDRLFAFVWRMIRDHHDAEELCQEAFLKAMAALDSFDTTYRFSTWLFTIAYRLTLNSMRRRRAFVGDVDFSVMASAEEDGAERTANSEEARRLKRIVWEAVDRLSPPQRASVLLFYKQRQGCNEIAEILDVPVATVKSHLHRARAKLKLMLEPLMSEEISRDRILREFAG